MASDNDDEENGFIASHCYLVWPSQQFRTVCRKERRTGTFPEWEQGSFLSCPRNHKVSFVGPVPFSLKKVTSNSLFCDFLGKWLEVTGATHTGSVPRCLHACWRERSFPSGWCHVLPQVTAFPGEEREFTSALFFSSTFISLNFSCSFLYTRTNSTSLLCQWTWARMEQRQQEK